MNISKHDHCIIGPGAIGLSLATLLSKSTDCSVLCKPEHRDVTTSQIHLQGDCSLTSNLVYKYTDQLSALDDTVFWICVKAYDLNILEELKHKASANSVFVLCSNGLNVFMDASNILRRDFALLRCLFSYGALKGSAGQIQISGEPRASLASLKGQEDICLQLHNLLSSVGFECSIQKDIATAEWKKAFINLLVNPICCVTNQPNKAVYEKEGLRFLAQKLYKEIQEVCISEGFDFSDLSFEKLIESLYPFGENINNSLVDLRNGKTSDLDYLLGRFIRIAKEYDVAVPTAKSLERILTAIESHKIFCGSASVTSI